MNTATSLCLVPRGWSLAIWNCERPDLDPVLESGCAALPATVCRIRSHGRVVPLAGSLTDPAGLGEPEGLTGAFRAALLPLLLPVIILGGICGGMFTPTQAATLAVLFALLAGAVVYRTLTLPASSRHCAHRCSARSPFSLSFRLPACLAVF
jgi:TRAP-type mannitol/chloroaromatic compound transport system permease large subunit